MPTAWPDPQSIAHNNQMLQQTILNGEDSAGYAGQRSSLPKMDVQVFDGDPLQFHCRAFENAVESKSDS